MRKMLFALTSLTLASVAIAAGGRENTTEYYSTKAKTKLVGEIIVGCGAHQRWGRTTAFFEHSSSPCNGLRTSAASSIAATSLLHHDPVFACHRRCLKIHWQSCPPPSPEQPECVQPRAACDAACDQLLEPAPE